MSEWSEEEWGRAVQSLPTPTPACQACGQPLSSWAELHTAGDCAVYESPDDPSVSDRVSDERLRETRKTVVVALARAASTGWYGGDDPPLASPAHYFTASCVLAADLLAARDRIARAVEALGPWCYDLAPGGLTCAEWQALPAHRVVETEFCAPCRAWAILTGDTP